MVVGVPIDYGPAQSIDNFYTVEFLDELFSTLETANEDDKLLSNTPYWLGETSSTYGGGSVNASDAYAAGFCWLDKLCLASLFHIGIVARQDLYGGNYGLLSSTASPLPGASA